MLCAQNSQEVTEDIEPMLETAMYTDVEELFGAQHCGSNKYPDKQFMPHDIIYAKHFHNCSPPGQEFDSQETEKKRKRHLKSQMQHCPSCHCHPDKGKSFSGKAKYTGNIEARLENYKRLIEEEVDPTIEKSQSILLSPSQYRSRHSPRCPNYVRKAQSGDRRQRKSLHDQKISSVIRNFVSNRIANENIESCCVHAKSMPINIEKDNYWGDQVQMSMPIENSDFDSGSPEKYAHNYEQYKNVPGPRIEPRIGKQCNEEVNISSCEGKIDTDDKDDVNWRQQLECDNIERNRLRSEYENVKRMDVQRKNTAIPMVNVSDYSKDDDFRKGKSSLSQKPRRQRSNVRKPNKNPGEDFTTNKEDVKHDTCCEIIIKDKDQTESILSKNFYAGGDLNLHTTKSHILNLIDRALSNEYGSALSQQKISEAKQDLTQREICIEITRELQGDCCQSLAQNLLSNHGSPADYVKQLKLLRWQHLNHIQDEFKKLCSLEKLLDTCSPSQPLPTFHSHSNAVEEAVEDRQQLQRDEKKEVITAP